MSERKRPIRCAVEILDRRFPPTADDLERQAIIEHDMEIAELIYAVRTEAGLTVDELAERVGTTAELMQDIEDAEYEGDSMSMLRRVAKALSRSVEVRMPRIDEPPKQIPA